MYMYMYIQTKVNYELVCIELIMGVNVYIGLYVLELVCIGLMMGVSVYRVNYGS